MIRKSILVVILTLSIFSCTKDGEKVPVADYTFLSEAYLGTGLVPVNTVIHFINSSLNATHYLWDFGDGTISMQENADHAYSQPGTYTIILVAQRTEFTDINNDEIINADDRDQNSDIASHTIEIVSP